MWDVLECDMLSLPQCVYTIAGRVNVLKVVSWNVRGLGDPLKRTIVSTSIRKYLPAICALQEIHLSPDTWSCLNFRWVGRAYHSTHPLFSRGVSVLIHSALDYQELDSVVDSEGRYVILYCRLFSLKCILAFVYIPPPYSHRVLRAELDFQFGWPGSADVYYG